MTIAVNHRDETVGRAAELAQLRRFVSHLRTGPAALVVEGPAGIGKTALMKAGLALTDGMTVLRCHPTESERVLAFTGLTDLLGPVAGPHLASLSAPKRSALEAALLLSEAPATSADPRAVATATLDVVRRLAEPAPLLLAVDDLQWLDASTSLVLRFVARRLESERVGFLVAHRGGFEEQLLLEGHGLEGRSGRIILSGLDPDLVDALLRARLSLRLPRPALTTVCEMCDGNPLHALEIGRVLKGSGDRTVAPARLSIPGSLQDLLLRRVAELPVGTRRLLVLAAALRRPNTRSLERAFGSGYAVNLERALRLQILEFSGSELRFVHPLLRTAVYQSVEESELRRIHARLADLVDDDDRAFHLALGTRDPSAEVARALFEAGGRARSRGAPAEAAELYEQAAVFTLPGDGQDRIDALISAGECHFLSGNTGRAKRLFEEVIERAVDNGTHATALLQAARIEWYSDPRAAEQLLRKALTLDPPEDTQSAVLLNLAWSVGNQGKLRDAVSAAARAHALAQGAGDLVLAHEALAAQGGFEAIAGDEGARANLIRAVEFERSTPVSKWLIEDRPSHILAIVYLRWGELEEARLLLEALLSEARDVGDELSTALLLADLGDLEWRSGRPAESLRYAEESCRLAEQTGTFADLGLLALGRATIGDVAGAREIATRQVETCERKGDILFGMLPALQTLAYVELVDGDAAAAAAPGLRAWRAIEELGIAEPGFCPQLVPAAEALIATGRPEDAEPIVAWLEQKGRSLNRIVALAAAHRCRGLLRASAGELGPATAELAKSAEMYGEFGSDFEVARTLLHDGTIRRRARQKSDARRSLEKAEEIFRSLGARAWVDKTVAESKRVGGRAPASASGLTPTERRVAELVAEGAANREIAEQLFISLRTVEANLTRIYRKLHLTSRRELARHVRKTEV